jgi:hypothetical protein
MEHSKRRFDILQQRDAAPAGERRRASRITHDHKGNASVQWIDVPDGFEDRIPLQIEEATQPASSGQPSTRGIHNGSLSIKTEDNFNPYARVPDGARKVSSTTRTDLRKLSAWIKLMRQMEESKRGRDEDEED